MKLFLATFLFCFSLVLNAQDEAELSEVTTRGGFVYKNNVLFTGTLYSGKANNKCKCTLEADYLNGKIIGSAKRYDVNGNIIIKSQPISDKQILEYALNIYKPNEYTDEFLKGYLYEFDDNYDNYKRNEFELKRKKQIAKQDIIKNIKAIRFGKTFKKITQTTLPKYSFKTNSYNLKFGFFLNYVKDYPITYLFSGYKMKSGDFRLSNRIMKVNIANKDNFYEIKLSPQKAEILKNNFKYNTLHYSYEYKILPTKLIVKDRYSRSGYIGGILAYITVMKFYSDKKLTNLVHTIYPSTSYDDFVKKSNANSTNKVSEVKKKINSTNKNNSRVGRTYKSGTTTNRSYKNNNSSIGSRKSNQPSKNSSTLIIESAEEGNLDSQYKLATMYVTGNGLLKDSNKAFYWYEKSAKSGFAKSQEELAAIYYNKNDYKNAFIWYTSAANNSILRAQYVLGYLYRKGIGTKKSRRKAKFWWKKSCGLGYRSSCTELKKMNAFGNALLKFAGEAVKNYNPKN